METDYHPPLGFFQVNFTVMCIFMGLLESYSRVGKITHIWILLREGILLSWREPFRTGFLFIHFHVSFLFLTVGQKPEEVSGKLQTLSDCGVGF